MSFVYHSRIFSKSYFLASDWVHGSVTKNGQIFERVSHIVLRETTEPSIESCLSEEAGFEDWIACSAKSEAAISFTPGAMNIFPPRLFASARAIIESG